jgi:hypothetical protein
MKTPIRLPVTLWLPVFVLLLAANARAQGGEDVDVQTSGPVHEGFANPTVFEDSSEPFYVDVDPPTLIEEAPPQERPANTEWVPGYWSYEDESHDWMWVSGTWRATPPGYVWVSGYWIKTWKGWRYVRGYWAPAGYGTNEIEYLPPPPPTLEAGPIGYQPWPNAIWVPGTWIWVSGGYLGWMWQPGYWIVYNPDWTWVPASYAWTPYGYIFIPGHYDHSCEHRGFLYAPVCFPRRSYLAVGFVFSPSFVINVSLFSGSFFTRPSYCHYYFGDYYSETCWNRGIYPAFSFQYTKYGYDPIFAHASIQYGKGNPHWAESQRSEYLLRRNDVTKRPAKTLALQNKMQGGPQIAVAAKDAGEKATKLKLERVPDSDKGLLIAQARAMRNARAERVKVEAADAKNDKIPDAPRKVKSQGFVPGGMIAKAAEQQTKVALPKQPDIPQKLEKAEPDFSGDRRRPTPGRGKLRDPSLDLPVQGGKVDAPKDPKSGLAGKEKESDDSTTEKRKPVEAGPGKKPDDVPGRRPPFTKPEDTGPGKKPGDDVGGKKPDDVPGRRPPFTKPEDTGPGKKPGDDVGGKKPDPIRPPARKPGDVQPGGKKPEDTQPGGKKPGDDAGGKKPGDDVGGRRPPIRKPEDNQPGKKPEDTGKKPEDTGKRPAGGGNQPPTNDPRNPKPGDRRLKPGEQPPPGTGPESKPVKKPNEKEREKGGGRN